MNYLQGWGTFCQWKRENPEIPLPETLNLSEINRFAARFRLAQSYEGINLKDYPESSIEAYGSLFGVFLAYSALEQLYKAVGKPNNVIADEWAIKEPKIANKLRKSKRLLIFIHEKLDSRRLKDKIIKFQEKENDNILVIAQAMRHLVAHGIMTIHAGRIKPQTTINFCNSVKQCVNDKSQICFTEYILNNIIDE